MGETAYVRARVMQGRPGEWLGFYAIRLTEAAVGRLVGQGVAGRALALLLDGYAVTSGHRTLWPMTVEDRLGTVPEVKNYREVGCDGVDAGPGLDLAPPPTDTTHGEAAAAGREEE